MDFEQEPTRRPYSSDEEAEEDEWKPSLRRDEDDEDEEIEERSSDDWSTLSEELSDGTRYGRNEEDPREYPVDLGPVSEDEQGFVDVSGVGGVLKKLYGEGRRDSVSPSDGCIVDLKYVMMLQDGQKVDVSCHETMPNKEHRFTVAGGEVFRGLEVAVKTMKREELARFRVRYDFAFGKEGCPPKVPAGTDWIVVDVQLMSFRRAHRDKLFLRGNEVLPYVLKRKEKGNEFFKAKEYWKAVHEYKGSLKAISLVSEDVYKAGLRDVSIVLFTNLAGAHLAIENWKRAIKYCSAVLQAEPSNEKALYRRGQALRHFSHRLEEARRDLAEAVRVSPNNKSIRQAYEEVRAMEKEKRKEDREAYGGIFKGKEIYQDKPRVFFEVSHGKDLVGRIEMELFKSEVPKTVENFRQLCVGTGKYGYKGTVFHRVIEGYILQGGDVTMQNGKGGCSIYGPKFDDESLSGKCDAAGLLCMANSGPNTNQSQFFILLAPCPELAGKYVVFGRVVKGKAVLKKMEKVACDSDDRPVQPLKIFKCGQIKARDAMLDDDDDE